MNNLIKIYFLISFIVSCDLETVIDLEIPQDAPMIVLNGVLDPDNIISVRISNSVGAFSNSNPAFLPNANVFLYENNSPVGQIYPDTDTTYYVYVRGDGVEISYPMLSYQINHVPIKGNTYRIEVDHPSFEQTAIAETKIPDEISIFNINIDTTLDEGNRTRFNFSFNDDASNVNYYRLRVSAQCSKSFEDEYGYFDEYYWDGDVDFFSNDPSFPQNNFFDADEPYSFVGEEVTFSDALFNGQEKTIILDVESYEYKFSNCDTINIEFSTFYEETYTYIRTLNNHLQNGEVNIFGGEVVSVYTNVQNGLGALISINKQIIPLK